MNRVVRAWRDRPLRVRAMAVVVVVGSLLCAAAAVVPSQPAAPVLASAVGAVLGLPLVLLVMWPSSRGEAVRLHVAAAVVLGRAMLLVSLAATGEVAVAAGLMIVWIGLYAIAFHPRGIARTYQVVMAAAFAVALASSDAVVAGMVAWLVVVASSVAASEIFGGMLTTMRLLAVTDPLTGLPNRQALDDLVDHHVRTASQCGVGAVLAVIDLDGLKQVNDVHGHLSGDRFLVRTAAALRDALGSRARLLRIGGDEFLALLPDTTPEAADRRLQSLQAGAALPFSYGLVAVDGTGDLDMWLAQADQRMYAQKRCRKERRSTTPVQPPVLHS